jgi:glycerophosphoryl diester phosphodiesterase
MTIIAHRCGPHAGAAENSVAAARRSLELGADVVELDIRFSRDGVPMVVHDPDLGRLCGSARRVADLDAADIVLRPYRDFPSVSPQPFRAFTDAGVAPLLVDFKEGEQRIEGFLEALAAARYLDRVVFGVRSVAALEAARRFQPHLRVLAFMPGPDDVDAFLGAGADIIRLWCSWMDARAVDLVHAAARSVWVMMGSPAGDRVGLASRSDVDRCIALHVDGCLLNDVALGVDAAHGAPRPAPRAGASSA